MTGCRAGVPFEGGMSVSGQKTCPGKSGQGSEIGHDSVFFPVAKPGRFRAVASTDLGGRLVPDLRFPAFLGLGDRTFSGFPNPPRSCGFPVVAVHITHHARTPGVSVNDAA